MKKLLYITIMVIVFSVCLPNYSRTYIADRGETTVEKTEEWPEVENFEKTADKAAEECIGNRKTKKFHLPTCSFLPDEKNRVYFDEEQDAVRSYYSPCYHCVP